MASDKVEYVRFSRSMQINHTSYEKYPELLLSVVAIEVQDSFRHPSHD